MSNRELLHENSFFKIYKDKTFYLEYNSNSRGVVASAVLIMNRAESRFLLIKNYREAINKDSWEAPRGGADQHESHLQCALRESKEETGYDIYGLQSLGMIAPDTGTMTTNIEVFKAYANENDIPSIVDTDDEITDVKWFDKEELLKMIKNNEIICGITLSLILKHTI